MTKSRRQRIYDNNRFEIIKAARVVFADKGFDKATISEIASEADFSVGTIYNFFQSKKDLFEALIENQFDTLITGIDEMTAKHSNPLERILFSFDWFCDLVENKEDLMKLWFDSVGVPVHKANLSDFQTRMNNAVFNAVQNNFKQAIEEGYLVDTDPYYLTVAIHSLFYSFLYDYIERRGEKTLREIINIAKNIF